MPEHSIEELKAENAALRAEIAKLRTNTALTMFGGVTTLAAGGERSTIVGLDEMVLTVGADDTVGYVNSSMMQLLKITDRRAAIGTPLSLWDLGLLGEGTLAALVQVARSSDKAHVLERPFQDIPNDLLPLCDVPESAPERIIRFTTSSKEGRVQIVAQDVTRVRWLENTFSRYVSPKVIDQLQRITSDELLTMERRELTILFSDLRGFTTLCQDAEPRAVQDTVNSYLATMVDSIEGLDGTVVGFAGDEVMALFGAPVPQTDHALRALICAVEMQTAHDRWTEVRLSRGDLTLPLGVGLATGTVVVGNIGTERRMGYTAQGHGVNLAARLCNAASSGEVLTTPETHGAAMKCLLTNTGDIKIPRLSFASKGKLTLKNVNEPIEVLSVRIKE